MVRQLRTLVEGGHFFEGPRWRDGTWWVSDMHGYEVLTVTPEGRVTTVMEVPEQPAGLGWLPDGSLLVASMRDHRVLRRDADGAVSEHADISAHCGGEVNDMIVDASGRAYVGNFGFDLHGGADPRPANLVRVDPDGTVSVAAEDLLFPNGCVILPGDRTLVVGETIGARYTAFSIDDDGSLADRRVWAQLGTTPRLAGVAEMIGEVMGTGTPAVDGCTLDAEGRIWAADALGARVLRIAHGGEVLDEIAMPEGLGAFACMLGGEDGTTLLVCAAPDFAAEARKAASEAVLFTTEVEVPHAGRP